EREHRDRGLRRSHTRVRPLPERVRGTSTGVSAAERRALVLILGYLTFASVYASVVMAPVLEPIASEFGITPGAAGLVVAAYGARASSPRRRPGARRWGSSGCCRSRPRCFSTSACDPHRRGSTSHASASSTGRS